jgi:transposase
MARTQPLLSDEQWAKIKSLLPPPSERSRGGRPRCEDRKVLEGILWVLKTGARWRALPAEYPSPSTCWRRLAQWEEEGVWLEIWRTFLAELEERGRLDWEESFADASFAPAKKGALPWGRRGAAKARSGWWWSTARVFLWESIWLRPRPTTANCWRPRSTKRTGRSASSG